MANRSLRRELSFLEILIAGIVGALRSCFNFHIGL